MLTENDENRIRKIIREELIKNLKFGFNVDDDYIKSVLYYDNGEIDEICESILSFTTKAVLH